MRLFFVACSVPNSCGTPALTETGLRCRACTRKSTAVVRAAVLQYNATVVIVPERRDCVKHLTKGLTPTIVAILVVVIIIIQFQRNNGVQDDPQREDFKPL